MRKFLARVTVTIILFERARERETHTHTEREKGGRYIYIATERKLDADPQVVLYNRL